MVKYGVRHHAHAVCLYQHRGIGAIDELHTWQLRHLPIVAMVAVGVTLEQVRAWQARIAAEDAKLAAQEESERWARYDACARCGVDSGQPCVATGDRHSLLWPPRIRRPHRGRSVLADGLP